MRELEDLAALVDARGFDSIWTFDRVAVPETSDTGAMSRPVGGMEQFPTQMPVPARGQWLHGMPIVPWLAARTSKVRIGMSVTVTPFRSPAVLAGEIATIDHLSKGRVNVGVGSGWLPEEFTAVGASHIFPRRHAHVRETIEVMRGIWTNDIFEYHGEFADFERSGFGARPVQRPHPPIYFSGVTDMKRSASRIATYDLSGWIGLHDTPEDIACWRATFQRELDEVGSARSLDDGFDMCSLLWFNVTDESSDQTPRGKLTNLLVGSADQIADNLKRFRDAGLTMPILWPPFNGVPISKTIDDIKRLVEEIMPAVNAG